MGVSRGGPTGRAYPAWAGLARESGRLHNIDLSFAAGLKDEGD